MKSIKDTCRPVAFLLLTCWIAGCKSTQKTGPGNAVQPIIVSSDFDCGSIGTLIESPANFLTGNSLHWKHKSSPDNQYYWFYFRMDHVLNKTVTVKLNRLIGIYRGNPHLIYTEGTQPVYSYDKIHWQRISDVRYNDSLHTFTFRNNYTRDSVWVAYAHPYPYSREMEFIRSLPGKSPCLNIEVLGVSEQSRSIRLLTITDPDVRDTEKKVVLITALQHAGEYTGGFFAEGMVNFLLSDQPEAVRARKKTIYKIVPMMNPDGIYHGMTRLNADYEDLNQEWDDDFTDAAHAPTEPEVACVKKWIRSWIKEGKKIDLGLDVHSQGQQGTMNILHVPGGMLADLSKQLNKYWPVELIPMTFSGSANDCLINEFHVTSGTFEIPQSNINDGPYLTIADYQSYGKGTVEGITDYFASSRP